MNYELKPCAHCAEPGIEVEQRRGDFHEWSIECSGCYCRTDWYGSREAAVAAWNTCANDNLTAESGVSDKRVDANDGSMAQADSRERLEADICKRINARSWGMNHDYMISCLVEWLDRQRTITEFDCWMNYVDMRDELEQQVGSLEAERDELRDELEFEKSENGWARDFLNRMGPKCGTADCPSLVAYVDNLEAERDELLDKLREKQRTVEIQRDSFAKMERECAELRQMLADAAEAI